MFKLFLFVFFPLLTDVRSNNMFHWRELVYYGMLFLLLMCELKLLWPSVYIKIYSLCRPNPALSCCYLLMLDTTQTIEIFGYIGAVTRMGVRFRGGECNGCMPVRAVCKPHSPDLKRGALATDAWGCSLWRSLLERPPPAPESRVRDPLRARTS